MGFIRLCVYTAILLWDFGLVDADCGDHATCNECNDSFTDTGYKCEWCVRAIGSEDHFGYCVDSEEKCKSGDETDVYLNNKMNEANITGVTWTASLKDTCGGGLAFDHSLLERQNCYNMACHFYDIASGGEFEMCLTGYSERACSSSNYMFNGKDYVLYKQGPVCYNISNCRDCNRIEACVWRIIQFNGQNAFGRCEEENYYYGPLYVPTLAGLDIFNVTKHEPERCENDGIIYSKAVLLALPQGCLWNGNLVCNFAEVSSNTGTQARVFDMCFLHNADHELKCPEMHNIDNRRYTVTQRTEADYECDGYASCNECKDSFARTGYNCVWCAKGIPGDTYIPHCVKKCRPTDDLRDKIYTDSSSLIGWSTAPSCEEVNFIVIDESDEVCVDNSNTFCKYDPDDYHAEEVGWCFMGIHVCPTEIQIRGKIYFLKLINRN